MKDATTRSLILNTVDKTTFTIISECETAVAMWSKLKRRFENNSVANQRLIYNEWNRLVYNSNDGSIRDYIAKFDTIASRYSAVGGQLDNNNKLLQLLHSIRCEKFDPVVKSPASLQMSYDRLCTQLMMYEDTWMKQHSSNGNGDRPVEAALMMTQRRNGSNNYNNNYN